MNQLTGEGLKTPEKVSQVIVFRSVHGLCRRIVLSDILAGTVHDRHKKFLEYFRDFCMALLPSIS